MNKRFIFWLDDISILYRDQNYLKFVPTQNMSKIEQLNAITRFLIYFIILCVMFNKQQEWMIISLIIICFTIYMNYVFKSNNKAKSKENIRVAKLEQFGNTEKVEKDGRRDIDIKPKIEAGYYDFQNNLHIGEKYDPSKYKKFKDPPFYNLDQTLQYEKASCRRPTVNNPFMNPLVTDFNDGDKPVACNADDEDINEEIVEKFNKNLYRNVDDLFETENSQRQFFTIPETRLPNQQKEFAMWLYGDMPSCKDGSDSGKCLKVDDLRFRR